MSNTKVGSEILYPDVVGQTGDYLGLTGGTLSGGLTMTYTGQTGATMTMVVSGGAVTAEEFIGSGADLSGIASWTTVPGSAGATGATGDVAYAAGFFYVCVATNTWQRAAISSF